MFSIWEVEGLFKDSVGEKGERSELELELEELEESESQLLSLPTSISLLVSTPSIVVASRQTIAADSRCI